MEQEQNLHHWVTRHALVLCTIIVHYQRGTFFYESNTDLEIA